MELAIFADCSRIIARFVKLKNLHYKTFCNVWNDMEFYKVFTACSSNTQIQQMAKVIFHYTKRTMCLRHINGVKNGVEQKAVLRRIGVLYLMYTIFYKQPLKQYVKIEVSPETWQEMKTFIEITLPKAEEFDEARYTFWKLFMDGAFAFATLDFHVGLDNLINYDEIYNPDSFLDKCHASEDFLKEYKELSAEIPALTELEDKYNAVKEKLINKYKLDREALPRTTIFHRMSECLGRIQSILNDESSQSNTGLARDSAKLRKKRKFAKSRKRNAANEKTNETTSVGTSKKLSLKRKAFKCELDQVSDDSSYTSEPTKKQGGRQTIRRILDTELPEDCNSELTEVLSIDKIEATLQEFLSEDEDNNMILPIL